MTDLRMKRGDSLVLSIGPVLNADRTVTNITGYAVKFTAKTRLDDADGSAVISVNGTIVNGAAGLASVTVPPSATDGFTTDRVLHYDIQISDPGGGKKTIDEGKLIVTRDVTRA